MSDIVLPPVETIHACFISVESDIATATALIAPMRKGGVGWINVWGPTDGDPRRISLRLLAFTPDVELARSEAEDVVDDFRRLGYAARIDSITPGAEADLVD